MISAHSMEEADALCDRLGIFVDGSLQCVGYPKEVRSSSDILYGNVFQNENVKWLSLHIKC
jgi:ABC-type multidrug transport system ATPase subunit